MPLKLISLGRKLSNARGLFARASQLQNPANPRSLTPNPTNPHFFLFGTAVANRKTTPPNRLRAETAADPLQLSLGL